MITAIVVTVSILGLLFIALGLLAVVIDVRSVLDVDKNVFVVEVLLFERFRILRFQLLSVGGEFYYKRLKKPYRSIEAMKAKVGDSISEIDEGKNEGSRKIDISKIYGALTKAKLNAETLRIYVMVGGEDSLATSMIWGGAEIVAAIAKNLIDNVITGESVSVLVKPEFSGADLAVDALIRTRLGDLAICGFKLLIILIGDKKRRKKAAV